jgi:hypothetical protein
VQQTTIMATDQKLMLLSRHCEDVASGLHEFRDGLPRSATTITLTISELFAVSSALRVLCNPKYDLRISRQDLELLFPSLQRTLDAIFHMFSRSSTRPLQSVWEALRLQFEGGEGISLLTRLQWYREYLKAQEDIQLGYEPQDFRRLRRQVVALLDGQENAARRASQQAIEPASTSRYSRPRPSYGEVQIPTSPGTILDGWNDPYRGASTMPPPRVPDPPIPTPISPTYTSTSSHTLDSSQTSYSGEMAFAPVDETMVHWAQDVFDGNMPSTGFDAAYQMCDVFSILCCTQLILTGPIPPCVSASWTIPPCDNLPTMAL